MRLSCLLLSLVLPLVKTKQFLLETHDGVKHVVAPTTKADATDQNVVGSKDEVERPLQAGQDYGRGYSVCEQMKCSYCKWAFILRLIPYLSKLF